MQSEFDECNLKENSLNMHGQAKTERALGSVSIKEARSVISRSVKHVLQHSTPAYTHTIAAIDVRTKEGNSWIIFSFIPEGALQATKHGGLTCE